MFQDFEAAETTSTHFLSLLQLIQRKAHFATSSILSFNCGLSIAKYRHRSPAMKNKHIGISRKSLIDRALPETQSNMASRANSFAPLFRIDSGADLIVKTYH